MLQQGGATEGTDTPVNNLSIYLVILYQVLLLVLIWSLETAFHALSFRGLESALFHHVSVL